MVYNMEFASRRAHRNNMDARRDFFLADVRRNGRHQASSLVNLFQTLRSSYGKE